jgi:hypothetical protein
MIADEERSCEGNKYQAGGGIIKRMLCVMIPPPLAADSLHNFSPHKRHV